MKNTKKTTILFTILFVMSLHTVSAFNCPAMGVTCSSVSDCCPNYVTDHGTFYGYCDTNARICSAADGINGNYNEQDWCRTFLYDPSGNRLTTSADFYAHYYGNSVNQYLNFLGWDEQKVSEFRTATGLHPCELLFPGHEDVAKIDGMGNGNQDFRANYDYKNNQVKLFDDQGNIIETKYYDTKGYGAMYASKGPISGLVTSSTDPLGKVLQSTDANGNKVRNYYDEQDRLIKAEYYKGTILNTVIKYFYDAYDPFYGGGNCTASGSSFNLLCEIQDGSGKVKFTYDQRGRVTKVEKTILDSIVGDRTYIFNYNYNSANSVVTITLPDSKQVSYTYNGLNQLIGIVYDSQDIAHINYDASGSIKQKVLNPAAANPANIIFADYFYDAKEQLRAIFYSNQLPRNQATALFQRSIQYDKVGNVANISYAVNLANPTPASLTNPEEQYSYDKLYRLTTAMYAGDRTFSYIYGAGKLGNRQSMSVNIAGSTASTFYTYTNQRLDSYLVSGGAAQSNGVTTLSYDNNGNAKTITAPDYAATFNYDALNRLTSVVKDTKESQYAYDYTNHRVKKSTSDGTTFYVYNGNQVMYEEHVPPGTCLYSCGDSNGDGTINIEDVNTFTNFVYGTTNSVLYLCPSDLNNDKIVDVNDLKLLIDYSIKAKGSAPVCGNLTTLAPDPKQGTTIQDIKSYIALP